MNKNLPQYTVVFHKFSVKRSQVQVCYITVVNLFKPTKDVFLSFLINPVTSNTY